ncbi:MAG: 3'-5' exonuclease [Chitinophagaceae bacterium]|nr:3'-5' exonuclease [Chitinophagaceae bacterium]
MNLNLKKPIACVDLETTGVNTNHDRIVEIAIIKVHPDGREEEKLMRLNPTIPIPAESTAVHGITDADVANEPTFKDVANEIKQFLNNCDLCGFNSNRFDFALLTEEFLRVDIDIDLKNRHLVDVQQIFFKKEPRNLAAAMQFYCNEGIENAHSAMADARATLQILYAQVEKYDDIENDISALHNFSMGEDFLDYARRIKIHNGEPHFNFGKFKDKSVASVFSKEPHYYDWIMKSDFANDTKQVLSKLYTEFKLLKK